MTTEDKGPDTHIHTVYEAMGGGYICSGCEKRFVSAEEVPTVDQIMEAVGEWVQTADDRDMMIAWPMEDWEWVSLRERLNKLMNR